MTGFIIVLFVLTYVGMALGRVPGLRVDRAGIAMAARPRPRRPVN
jgi:hypothetical protein